MVSIYCIEDINDLKYIGSTKQTLNKRLAGHRVDECRGYAISSSKLNLYDCIIYELERCPENERKVRERYWINKIDCVNVRKLNYDDAEYKRNYREQAIINTRNFRMRNKLIYQFLEMLKEY